MEAARHLGNRLGANFLKQWNMEFFFFSKAGAADSKASLCSFLTHDTDTTAN